MKSRFRSAAALVLVAMLTQLAPAVDKPDDPSAWQHDLLAWREKRATSLQAPEGWLSLIALGWLQEGDNTVGSSDDSRVQIAAKVPARIAVVRLEKGALQLRAPVGGFPKDLVVDGQPAKEQPLLSDDAENPSKLTLGGVTIIVIHRDDRYGLRVKDLQAPTRTAFHGLHWYAPSPSYRIHARWIPYDPPKILDIPTILGTTTHLPAPGVAEFTIDGQVVRLEPVLEDPKSTDLFLHHARHHQQNHNLRRRTLPLHRTSRPRRKSARRTLARFQSTRESTLRLHSLRDLPLPPPQNRLPVPIPAGEQRYHD